MEMTSNQPYLFRAIYDWIIDNGATPYVLVDASGENVKVPQQSIQNGQIVLNIAPRAVTNYHADETAVSFSARFAGVAQHIFIPMQNIMALYAAENGQGMVFAQDTESMHQPSESEAASTPASASTSDEATEPEQTNNQPSKKKGKKSFLKVVK